MTPKIIDDYFSNTRERYSKSTKEEKSRILTEFTLSTKLNRKYSIRILNGYSLKKIKKRPGRKKIYNDPELLVILKTIWKKTNLLCSKRLKSVIPNWLPYYEKHVGEIPDKTRILLLSISDRTIDRLFSKFRKRYNKRGFCTI